MDFDLVSLSSLNRHAVATREDVGTPKATCLVKHFKRIMPEVRDGTHSSLLLQIGTILKITMLILMCE